MMDTIKALAASLALGVLMVVVISLCWPLVIFALIWDLVRDADDDE